MGSISKPDIIIPIRDTSTGALKTGLTVKIVPVDGVLGTDDILLSEIGTTGVYAKTTAVGVDAVAQDVYKVYADRGSGAVIRGLFTHGGDFRDNHLDSVSNPHNVIASQLNLVDVGNYYSATEIEAALQEIGVNFATKAGQANTILTDNSTQSVAKGKPIVRNLIVDMLDGKHTQNAANSIPVLDKNADLPLAQIPDTLTGKSADKVDQKIPGSGNDNLAILSDSKAAGKIDTSLLGIKAGAGGGLDADTVDGKHVGTDDGKIPEISSNKAAGKIDTSLLGQKWGRRGTYNDGDTPEADQYGGGIIWVDGYVPDNTTPIQLDNSIDWRDRWIIVTGFLDRISSAADRIPGGSSDQYLYGSLINDGADLSNLALATLFTRAGSTGANVYPFTYLYVGGGDELYLWADDTDGSLKIGKNSASSGDLFAFGLQIQYSPEQNHY